MAATQRVEECHDANNQFILFPAIRTLQPAIYWRPVTHRALDSTVVKDLDPYSDKRLFEMQGASVGGVNDTYAAARAFADWHDEIVDWLIHEAGATTHGPN